MSGGIINYENTYDQSDLDAEVIVVTGKIVPIKCYIWTKGFLISKFGIEQKFESVYN